MNERIDQIFNLLSTRFKRDKAGAVQGTFMFEIGDHKPVYYTVELGLRDCHINPEKIENPTCTVSADRKTFLDVFEGRLRAEEAFMSGKLKVSDPMLMLNFNKMFDNAKEPATHPSSVHRPPLKGPLEGIKVIDFSHNLPGPLGTRMLAELGAEVIKIEDPYFPDPARSYPPLYNEKSVFYLSFNFSKKSVSLSFSDPEDMARLEILIRSADILVESFRPGRMEKFGLGYRQVKEWNPKIIYASVTGYGQKGLLADKAGHDINYLALSGLLGQMRKNGQPVLPAVQIADVGGGSYALMAQIFLALWMRERSGEGRYLDVSMVDTLLPYMSIPFASAQAEQKNIAPENSMLGGLLPNYNVYRCADGRFVVMGALEPKFWDRFCEGVQKPEWKKRLMEVLSEGENNLKEAVQAEFLLRDAKDWVALGTEWDCCITQVADPLELDTIPHLRERNSFINATQHGWKEMKIPRAPFVKSFDVPEQGWQAPDLGEDNQIVK